MEKDIKEANARLKSAGTRLAIQRRGNRLWLRGTLPPKPHFNKLKPYQQRMAIDCKASAAGLKKAEQLARKISAELELGQFNWKDYQDFDETETKSLVTVSQLEEKFTLHHWSNREKNKKSIGSWGTTYQRCFARLPKNAIATLDLFVEVVKSTKPDTKTRLSTCIYLHKIAKFGDMDGAEKLLELKGNYSPSKVQPRNLPSDTKVAEIVEAEKNQQWRWVIGMLATYGLRSHEIFFLDLSEFPAVRVLEGKTGPRIVYPLYPEWASKWGLSEVKLPNINIETITHCDLGEKVANWFWCKKIPFKAYDLRHCYARRCFEFEIPPDRSAKLMGHSLKIHCDTYRQWIDEKYYRKFFEKEIMRENRPKPPS